MHSPDGYNSLGLDQAKARSWELHLGLLHEWQEPRHCDGIQMSQVVASTAVQCLPWDLFILISDLLQLADFVVCMHSSLRRFFFVGASLKRLPLS